MDRVRVEKALSKMNISEKRKGFFQIADVLILMDNGWKDLPMTKLYWKVGKDRGIQPHCVERNIRLALGFARKNGPVDAIEHYIGTDNIKNRTSIRHFYSVLKEEEQKEGQE